MPDEQDRDSESAEPDTGELISNETTEFHRVEESPEVHDEEIEDTTEPAVSEEPELIADVVERKDVQVPVEAPKPTETVADKETPKEEVPHVGAGNMILQWLSYAFWGWTLLALAWLTYVTISHFTESASGSYPESGIAYPLAAVFVLFIISFITDVIYAKMEPQKKAGVPMIIMVIHVVLFSLFGIGFLVAGVFGLVQILIGASDGDSSSGSFTLLVGSLIVAVTYAATLLRTLRPKVFRKVPVFYWVFMALVTVTMLALAVTGPVKDVNESKTDRIIESGLPVVSDAVNDYAQTNGTLPTSLSVLTPDLSGDAKTVVQDNLARYTAGEVIKENVSLFAPTSGSSAPVFSYRLCVEYKVQSPYFNERDSRYSGYNKTTPDTYSHDAGNVCYDLQTDDVR